MLADILDVNGEKIEIHVINLIDHDYFSIYALDKNETLVQGTEIQVKKPFKMDLLEFSLQAHTASIVNFLRQQIENFGLEPWRDEAVDVEFQTRESIDDLYTAGSRAFLAGKHYRINPFIQVNAFRQKEWHRGWMDEAMRHPERFDFRKDDFVVEDTITG